MGIGQPKLKYLKFRGFKVFKLNRPRFTRPQSAKMCLSKNNCSQSFFSISETKNYKMTPRLCTKAHFSNLEVSFRLKFNVKRAPHV